jgi:hypothetical protein
MKGEFMRELTSHKVNGLNEALTIRVFDEPGNGGACHRYGICFTQDVPGAEVGAGDWNSECEISFQDGPIAEAGINGISQEALLAVVVDRLECFQKGQYSCRENAIALTKLQEAMHWLQHRTRERVARGVEGTSQK